MAIYDFATIHAASKSEQIRAYSIEVAAEHLEEMHTAGLVSAKSLTKLAKEIESFILNGDVAYPVGSNRGANG